jgi:hypothetical protein
LLDLTVKELVRHAFTEGAYSTDTPQPVNE